MASSKVSKKFSITWKDLPLVIISNICFISYIAMGFFVCAIGAAIPEIGNALDRENTSLGIIYTARGIGFLLGTIFGSAQNEILFFKSIRKDIMVCIPVSIVGVGAFVLFMIPIDLWAILIIVCIQASMFSFLDVVANILLMEIWGTRVEPWLQALHAFFGVGGVLGPTIVGVIRFQNSNLCLCVICLIPSIIALSSMYWNRGNDVRSVAGEYSVSPSDENTAGNRSNVVSEEEIEELDDKLKQTNIDNKELNNDKNSNEICNTSSTGLIPNQLRMTFVCFYFIYVGLETGFGGWISAYSLDTNVTDSESKAAYLSSIFFFGITIGRVCSVPIAMFARPTLMMRCQLLIVLLGMLIFSSVTLSGEQATYASLVVSCAVFGIGISSIYPVGLTIAQDYRVVMDSRTISLCCIGAVCGEAIVPMCFGLLMNSYTPTYLTYSTIVVTLIVTMLYVLIHVQFMKITNISNNNSNFLSEISNGDIELNSSPKNESHSSETFNPLSQEVEE